MLTVHTIFDLDGTLIDSAEAVLASYRAAFSACGIEPKRPITADIIGPPLGEALRMLGAVHIDPLVDAFRQSYDSKGLFETRAYGGVDPMLRALRAAGMSLSIATNKRIHPTRLILEHLGWAGLFDAVYALDIFAPPLPDKATLLGHLLADRRINRFQAVYVGDRVEDGKAADANDLPFIAANWGYGTGFTAVREAATPSALEQMLLGEK